MNGKGATALSLLCVALVSTLCRGDLILWDPQCGDNAPTTSALSKVAGGAYATEGQFPFMAAVHRRTGNGRYAQCGGTILSARCVLTAAHCLGPDGSSQLFLVAFGIVEKRGMVYELLWGPGESMFATRSLRHPRYNAAANVNDIGLLYMPRDIPFSGTIQPIKLAGHAYERTSFVGADARVVGWGRDTPTSLPARLKYAMVPIISNAGCSRYWRISDKHICTAPGVGRDACQGDSGGPLLVTVNHRPLQIGLVSYGDAGCPSSRPGVYTRVSAFTDWIQTATGLRY